jgi:carbon-monoxide dehydrogenase medium subunit
LLRPSSLDEACRELERLGERAAVYAGGAELLLLIRNGLAEPELLVDIKAIEHLHALYWDGVALHIGATVTHHTIESNPLIARHAPTLQRAEHYVANIRVRNQGTIGGNLCFADPHADPGTVLMVHDAEVSVESANGGRTLRLEDFVVGTYATALNPGEILAEVIVPPLPAGWSAAFARVERFSRPTANVAVAVRMDGDRVAEARLCVGCIGPKALRIRQIERGVAGLRIEEAGQHISDSAHLIEEILNPVDDLLGSADYKVHIAGVLLRRTLVRAAAVGHE